MRKALAIVAEEGLASMGRQHTAMHQRLWQGSRTVETDTLCEAWHGTPCLGELLVSHNCIIVSLLCRYAMREALAIVAQEGLTLCERANRDAPELWQGLRDVRTRVSA